MILGRKVEFLILYSSPGKALSLNINNNFRIALGREKNISAVACSRNAAKVSHNCLRELKFTRNRWLFTPLGNTNAFMRITQSQKCL